MSVQVRTGNDESFVIWLSLKRPVLSEMHIPTNSFVVLLHPSGWQPLK